MCVRWEGYIGLGRGGREAKVEREGTLTPRSCPISLHRTAAILQGGGSAGSLSRIRRCVPSGMPLGPGGLGRVGSASGDGCLFGRRP